ncbi:MULTISPECIES: LysR family transcriptional regulator [unclassified Rhizobium]|uniref:LysR family transcriptional regulator n=1 Tax=unclassified Rhizobium TaxID=2613769 RepID=UPI000B52F1F5|nr:MULTISPECIES: LysR family transcriptional regulator [unclassified Rhizobium]
MRLLVSRHLENFLALYEARNMHKASLGKGITQPALTKSLKILEDEIGSMLFVRTSRGLEPTEAGETLYRYARTIDQEARFAALDINNVVSKNGSNIRIGVGPGLAVSSFPKVLVNFHRKFPGVKVIAQMGLTKQLVEDLMRDSLDVIATARPPQELPEHISCIHLFDIHLAVVCRKSHPLNSSKDIGIEDLFDYGCVTFPESDEFIKRSHQLFGQTADKLNVVVETNSISVMLDLVASADYFALVGEIIVPRAMQAGLVRLPVPSLEWDMKIDLMCKTSLVETRPVRALREAWASYRA